MNEAAESNEIEDSNQYPRVTRSHNFEDPESDKSELSDKSEPDKFIPIIKLNFLTFRACI